MKSLTEHIKRASLAVVALSSIVAIPSAFAAIGETNAGDTISNSAKVDYQVGGVGQPQITSLPATFTVDRKVLFTVAEVSLNATIVTPGQINQVTAFRVSNTGNASEGFQLTGANQSPAGATLFGKVDNQDMNSVRVFVDVNNNGVYDAGDTATAINTLARDTSQIVFIVADTTNAFTNNQFANVTLTARAAVAGTSGATLEVNSATDTVGGLPDVVIGVAGNTASDFDQYEIRSAALVVAKTSTVIADPINCPTGPASCGANVPKAIPGATIQYTITVTNNGQNAADLVSITDAGVSSAFASGSVTYVAGSLILGATTLTDAADADGGTAAGSPVSSITVAAGTITPISTAPANVATVKFQVKIK
jgi:uncharacterized repeat protein (TIGR01451 family)